MHGWFVPGRTDTTILWFHGNGSNLSHPGRVEHIKLLHDRLGVSFFIFDYRGYGRSAGRPSEPGLYQDAQDAFAYLRSREDVNPERIVYYGKSLGGAVASHLATPESTLPANSGIHVHVHAGHGAGAVPVPAAAPFSLYPLQQPPAPRRDPCARAHHSR